MLLVEKVKQARADAKRRKRDVIEAFRPGIVMSLEALIQRATVGFRVCQYPDGTRPTLIYFAEDSLPGEPLLQMLRCFAKRNDLGPITDENYEEHVTRFFKFFQHVGYNVLYGNTDSPHQLVECINYLELTSGRVVGVAWSALEEDPDVYSSYRTPLERNHSDADGSAEGDVGGSPLLPQ